MAITDWPLEERPREKLLERGAKSLSDAELLAIFLRTGTAGKTAVDLARDLINHFGSLRGLLKADCEEFCQFSGLGIAKFAQLQAALEMTQRHLMETLSREDALENSFDTRRYIIGRLREYEQEVFACLFLDARHRVISFDELFFGTLDHTLVHPREVVKKALHHNAHSLIFAHNHPSGVAEPSQADITLTQDLKRALKLIEIKVLDHIIVGDGNTTSLLDAGLL